MKKKSFRSLLKSIDEAREIHKMSEHKTTFNYIQYGNVRRATLICSECRLTMEIDCLKVSTRMAEAEFQKLHETLKSKKSKKQKSEEPLREKEERQSEPDGNNPEWPDEGGNQS